MAQVYHSPDHSIPAGDQPYDPWSNAASERARYRSSTTCFMRVQPRIVGMVLYSNTITYESTRFRKLILHFLG